MCLFLSVFGLAAFIDVYSLKIRWNLLQLTSFRKFLDIYLKFRKRAIISAKPYTGSIFILLLHTNIKIKYMYLFFTICLILRKNSSFEYCEFISIDSN